MPAEKIGIAAVGVLPHDYERGLELIRKGEQVP
jgi:hypothetical protein